MTTTAQNKPTAKARILIVDDDQLVLELLGLSISSFGFEPVAAHNGKEALAYLEEQEFEIVITDMMMPEMDGMQLLAEINKRYPKTDVIVVTGYTGTFSYMDVIRAGASDFISKPFNSDELEAKINRILREHQLISKLEHLSNCDHLTELYNRRYFDQKIVEEAHRATRQNYPLFLIMLDVDNFKAYNDQYGHQRGDQVLINIADILRRCTRADVDLLFRHGGDEFSIITPHVTREQVTGVGERIIKSFTEGAFKNTGLSLGIAKFQRTENSWAHDIHNLVSRADQALYRAKAQGRNQMIFAHETEPGN
jgi:two-component system, cell cycle response regulator